MSGPRPWRPDRPESADLPCPVCWSRVEVVPCPVCEWDFRDDAAGVHRRERSAAADWDLQAALRASRAAPDRHRPARRGRVLPELEGLLRRSPPVWDTELSVWHTGPAAWEDRPAADPPGRGGRAGALVVDWSGAVSVLTALAAGEVDAVHFLSVSAAGLTADVLVRDNGGALCAREDRRAEITWPEVAPWLPRAAAERDFLLAGGVGVSPPYGTGGLPHAADLLWNAPVGRAAGTLLGALRRARDEGRSAPLVLAGGAPGWRWPDLALRAVAHAVPPAATITLADDRAPANLVATVCRGVPLRHGYALLTRRPGTESDASAQERIKPLLLFPSGTLLPDDGELSVNVTLRAAADETRSTFALPLVVARGASPQDWALVRTGQVRIGPGEQTDVTVVLDGSAGPRFTGPDTVVETLVDEDLLLGRPAPAADRPADLLVLLELGGSAADLARRTGLLTGVLEQLAAQWPESSRLRVGAIGYGGHTFGPVRTSAGEDVLTYSHLGTARDVARELSAWRPAPPGHAFAAPLEDALHAAEHSRMWRADARHLLLVVGSRPPHPARQERDLALPCTNGWNWTDSLRGLREGRRARVIAVRDPQPPPRNWRRQSLDRLRHAWLELGRQGSFELDAHGPEDVASAVRAAAGLRGAPPGLMVDAHDGAAVFGTWTRNENEES